LFLVDWLNISTTINLNNMKILLEINDDKAIHLVEVLKGLPYV